MIERKRVGVLLESNPSNYSRALRAQLEKQATKYRFDVGILGVPWATESEEQTSLTVEQSLKEAAQFHALVLISGVFSDALKKLSRLSQHWAPRPIVSIGYRLAGVPSLLVDNRASTRHATNHLIETHGRNRLLFLRGRRDSQEAEQRYLGFRHALRDGRILHEERRILQADFTQEGTARAFAALDPQVEFDGIVAANDDMALAAFSEVQRRGLKIPEDVSVIGFDDIRQAALAPVPLSTLAQPFEKMAGAALHSLGHQFSNRIAPQVTSVPVEMITRRSCGCPKKS